MNVVGDIYYDGTLISYSPLMLGDDVCMKDHVTGKWVKCGVHASADGLIGWLILNLPFPQNIKEDKGYKYEWKCL